MTTLNLNESPYFDDIKESKNFYQILFRPGRAVQARELNQIQSLIKSQIDRFGKFVFDNGSVVYPLNSEESAKYTNNVAFIKIPTTAPFADTEQNLKTYWLGKTITSTSGALGITAKVIGVRSGDSLGQARLFLNYLSANSSGETSVGTFISFTSGQNIRTVEPVPISATISAGTNVVGAISSVTILKSVFFYNGRFILVDEQTIFITPPASEINDNSKWTNSPTVSVGLEFIESFETWVNDESLLDNASGSPNIGAPGADRLRVTANLIQLPINEVSGKQDYVELFKIISGDVQKRVTKTSLSDIGLEKQLATRTFEESGNYTVVPFQLQIKDFLRTNTNNGANVEQLFYYSTPEAAAAASVDIFELSSPASASAPEGGKYVPGTSYDTIGDLTSFKSLCEQRLSILLDPGLAYVNGYRIEKNATTNLTLKKARDLKFRNNKFISAPLGNYVYVKDVSGGLNTSSYKQVNLYSTFVGASPTLIGDARVLSLEYFSGWRSSDSVDTRIYRLFLFDVNMRPGYKFEDTKSIQASNPSFSCNIQLDRFRLTGTASRQSTNTIIGSGTSWRNDESQRLKKGDYIEVNAGNPGAKIYSLAENPSSDNQLKTVENLSSDTWPSGSNIDYLYALLRTDSDSSGLIYKLPDAPIFTIRGAASNGSVDSNSIDTVYTTKISSATTLSALSNKLLIEPLADTQFEAFSPTAYSVIKIAQTTPAGASVGAHLQVLPYSSGTPSAGFAEVRPNNNNRLEIYLNAADAGGSAQFQVHYGLVKLGNDASKEKLKNLVKGSFLNGQYSGDGWAVSSGGDVSEINLGKADVLRITRIVESPDYSTVPSSLQTLPSGHKDITGIYILDNGQRDYYYDIAKVTLRPGYSRPRGRVRVEFDYFTSTGNGDYFSVNSYPFVGNTTNTTPVMEYSDIPVYTASDGTTYDLASCFDFRPTVSAGGSASGFSQEMAIPKESIRCDYHFYLPRKDKIFLNSATKEFSIKYGRSDENPVFPEDSDNALVIYELDVGAYTFSTTDVFPKMRENKRYTMRDIGKLENRISNLEYYTSLSLLEKDTNSLTVKDALGRDRFKNGFLVDNFKTFAASDMSTSDFRCAIDTSSGVVRPIIHEDPNPPKLIEQALLQSADSATINSYRVRKNYQKTGEIYTLPYTEQTFIEQSLASKFLNVNPYSAIVYVGRVSITPWTDEWRETSFAEPLNIKDESAFQAARASFGPSGTRVDYTSTVNNWLSVSSTTEETGGLRILKTAGEAIRGLLKITKAKWEKMRFVKVPPGYANTGELIPIAEISTVSKETKTTTTQTGERITTNFTSTFQDQGFSAPISLGERIIDTSLIEYIRSREINFSGKAFAPLCRVYPFFDGVDVSAYCAPTGGNVGDPLICDGTGSISGTFTIPDPKTTGIRFKTGDRIFRLTTSNINQLTPPPESAGDARYSARGWIDTKQETTLSTRLFSIASNATTSSEAISQILSTTFGETKACPQDPLAQAFLVKESGGCFITSVNVFFQSKPENVAVSPLVPITLQLRTMSDDGYPTNKILPFGEVIKPQAEVNTNRFDVANNKIIINGIPTEYTGNPKDLMVPTTFTFPSPVYVSEGQYYCIVLIANSTEYNVWIAENGPDTDVVDVTARPNNVEIGTQTPILKPTFLEGALFSSENGVNWVLRPTQDLKFKINKAVFTTSVVAEIDYVNEQLPLKQLTLDPLEFTGSSIRILHPNHGHTTARIPATNGGASKVVFSPKYNTQLTGVTATSESTTVSGNFSLMSVGGYIKHPINGENRRVVAKALDNSSITIRTPFSAPILAEYSVPASTVVYPTTSNLGGLPSDMLFDYRGHDVLHTELDSYRILLPTPGTVSVTQNSKTVIGSGTLFTKDYAPGDKISINGDEYTIDVITNDTTLTLTANYTSSTQSSLSLIKNGRYGGSEIFATENKRYEELTLITTPLELPDTEINWNIETLSGCGPNNSTVSTYNVQPRRRLIPNERLTFDSPMIVASYINELDAAGDPATPGGPGYSNFTPTDAIGDRKSLKVRAVLRSKNPNLSPIIDESRMTAYLVANRLDDPKGISTDSGDSGQVINTTFDNYVCVPTTVSPAVSTTANKLYFVSSPTSISGVTGVAQSRSITGSGTTFTTALKVGDIVTTSQKESRKVTQIISDTEIIVDSALLISFTSSNLYVNPPNLRIKSADANIAKHLSNLDVGKYLSISGSDSSNRDFSDKLITAVNYTPNNTVNDSDFSPASPKLIEIEVDYKLLLSSALETNSVTLTQKDRFVDEISPGFGSCASKYVSKKLVVARPSNALKVMFEGSRDETCKIELYYKLDLVNSPFPFESVNWTKANFNTEQNGVYVDATPPANLSNLDFSDYECTINDLPAFTGAQVKIVMRGGNPARSVRVKNLRLLVLDD